MREIILTIFALSLSNGGDHVGIVHSSQMMDILPMNVTTFLEETIGIPLCTHPRISTTLSDIILTCVSLP